MFNVKPKYIKQVSFASKLFPKLRSPVGIELEKLKSSDEFDGEIFCGGRSKNKDLLTFFGFIHDPKSGCAAFTQLPTFRRSLKKLVNLVEQEIESIGAQEILIPTLVLQELWRKSGRLARQPSALDHTYKLSDGNRNELLLGPTFEESITQMIADYDSICEPELPILLYQTSPKFRFEPTPRFGLIRSNEFLMNDLYTFDANFDNAVKTYDLVTNVYERIFDRLGLKCKRVQGGTGEIGGDYSHEYQLPVSSGEDTIVECPRCGRITNVEIFASKTANSSTICPDCGETKTRRVQTIELGHTFLLSDIYSAPFKATYISKEGGKRIGYQMGCYGLGLTRILGAGIDLLSKVSSSGQSNNPLQIRWPSEIEPYKIGLVIPAKRSKQNQAGSTEFVQRLLDEMLESSYNADILIEDRDKEGIGRRLMKLQAIGIPNIIVVGQRFLEDPPEVELLRLDSQKTNYEQCWLTKDQICDYLRKI